MRLKIFLQDILIILLFLPPIYFAQSLGANFTLGFPMNEFKENVKRTGIGGSAQFLLWNPTSQFPYSFGIDAGYINYGSETRREPFSHSIPDVNVDVSRTNNIINFHLLGQIILPSGSIRPYIEFLVGGSYIFTQTQINSSGSEEVASTTNYDDWAWNYGGGGGFLIRLIPNTILENKIGGIFLDLKVRYLYGTEAQYLKEGSVIVNRGRVFYDVSKSKTDLLTANIGVVIYFENLFESD